jgi:hypothetical protein
VALNAIFLPLSSLSFQSIFTWYYHLVHGLGVTLRGTHLRNLHRDCEWSLYLHCFALYVDCSVCRVKFEYGGVDE